MTLNSGSILILALKQELTDVIQQSASSDGREDKAAYIPNMTLAAIQQHQMNIGETLGVEASKLSVARQLKVVIALAAARQADA
jgi:hypothetical protein